MQTIAESKRFCLIVCYNSIASEMIAANEVLTCFHQICVADSSQSPHRQQSPIYGNYRLQQCSLSYQIIQISNLAVPSVFVIRVVCCVDNACRNRSRKCYKVCVLPKQSKIIVVELVWQYTNLVTSSTCLLYQQDKKETTKAFNFRHIFSHMRNARGESQQEIPGRSLNGIGKCFLIL